MEARRTALHLRSTTVSLVEWAPSSPAAPTIVLLHGGGADSAELSWGELGPAIAAAGHRVLAPDHPGFGESPRASWRLTQEHLVSYVAELIDALRLDDYVIGGLSLGGGMTIGHLLDQPGRARGAVLLGSYGLMPRLYSGRLGFLAHLGTFALERSGVLAALTRSYSRDRGAMERGIAGLIRDPLRRTPGLVDAIMAEAAGTGPTVFREWQRDQVRATGLRTVYTDRLATIRTPTLLVHGDHDSGVPIAHAEKAASLLPQGRLVSVPGAGHWVQRDRPQRVIAAVIEHVRSLTDAETTDPR